jgi:hypothetical protein
LGNPYAAARLAELEESGSGPEVPQNLEKALLHWAQASKLFDDLGTSESDDAIYVRYRKASIARWFLADDGFDSLKKVSRELHHNR